MEELSIKCSHAWGSRCMILQLIQDNRILLLLSSPANLLTTSSSERSLDSFCSIDNTAKSINRCSDMLDRKQLFVHFKHENDLSHSAVVTTIVRAIWRTFVTVGNAIVNGIISFSTSLILQTSLPLKVRLAIRHSAESESLLRLYASIKGVRKSTSRKCRVGITALYCPYDLDIFIFKSTVQF